ncbi:DUF2231 domain-containing protein [Maricaulis sp. CAU 1757]
MRTFVSVLGLVAGLLILSPAAGASLHPPAESEEPVEASSPDTHDHPAGTPDQDHPAAVQDHAHPADTPAHEHSAPAGDADAMDTPAHAHAPQEAHDHHAGEHSAGADPCAGGAEDDLHGAAATTAGGHAHWGDHGPQNDFERAIAATGALHPVAVHFPVALILVAGLAQILAWLQPQAPWTHSVRYLVWTAAAGGLAAGLLGWAHAGPPATGEAGLMAWHRWIGTVMTVVLLVTAGLFEAAERGAGRSVRVAAVALLFASATVVAVNAFLGGSLAHGGLRHLIGG